MPVSLSDVGRRGRMELTFAPQEGRTVLQDSYCEVPFKITRVLNSHQPFAHLILMQCTAGLFGGDDVECSIRVERGARAWITQQSATRVHPSRDRQAIQRNRIFVAANAELHLYLEPIIPFADSRLCQTTVLDVESGGTLYFWEGFMTGRIGRGESWRFRELAAETQLYYGGRLTYLDRFRLTPETHQCSEWRSEWAMGERNYLAAGIYVGENAGRFAAVLHESLPDAGVDALTDYAAATRVISENGPDFHRRRELFCQLADQNSLASRALTNRASGTTGLPKIPETSKTLTKR